MKRYVVHPGTMMSKSDRQMHFIGFGQLVQLYNISPTECVNAETTPEHLWPKDAVHLYPDYNGNYSLPR